jgi:hypothetical protein
MASETLALVEALDASFTLRSQMSAMLGMDILLLMMTDSKSLFDIMTTQKRPTEDRLMFDIFAARQSFKRGEIDNISSIRSELNLADDRTKLQGNSPLLRAMRSCRIQHPIVDLLCVVYRLAATISECMKPFCNCCVSFESTSHRLRCPSVSS